MRHTAWVFGAFLLSPSGVLAQTAPPAASDAHEATVVALHGAVEAQSPGASTGRAPAAGEVLAAGTRLSASEGATVVLSLPNGATLTLLPDSQLTLFGSASPPAANAPPSTITTLEYGSVRVSAAADEQRPTIPLTLGTSVVALGRGDAVISSVRRAVRTQVSVHRGRVQVRTGSHVRLVRAGQGVRMTNGAPASSFFSLAAAPSWREAPPRELPTLGGAGPVSLSYSASGGPGVRSWRVELARDADFRDLVVSERLPPRQLRWDGALQGAGDWYARVSAIDALGLDGVPSSAAHITVTAPAIVPGAEAAGDSPARPATLRAPAGVFCGVDGARLVPVPEPVRLTPARTHTVRCARDASGADAQEFTVTARDAGPVLHDVQLRATGASGRVLSLRLSDLAGIPIPYANVRVTSDAGVLIDDLREASERGVYVAAIQWRGARARIPLRFTVNDGLSFSHDVAIDDASHAAP